MARKKAAPSPAGGRLIHCTDQDPGLSRHPVGDPRDRTWRYTDPDGRRVTDPATLDRIARLAIPPAWTDVWIADCADCHLQATGRDARGRKQYRYHADWRAARDSAKFDRVAAFGRALPGLRRRLDADLARRGLCREKVLAAVVTLLEATLIRVGNDEYARQNRSYGLTTLRNRHATVNSMGGVFEFRGKSGKRHSIAFRDRRLARIVKAVAELPGQELFQYRDDEGEVRDVTSGDVNAYLKEITGEDFTAKDFRTWAGTVEAARELCTAEASQSTATRATVSACVKAVAGKLGNTPAVCRKAYIHPAVTEAFERRQLNLKAGRSERAFENALIRFLERSAN
ncbi:MAG: DNA topoisomerase IB [Caulobacter sp.]|nr:DNA topoisomerase IB [Caulobacter sp.]